MDDPNLDEAVDGFTWYDIWGFALSNVVPARCECCETERDVEPDATNYDCFECGTPGSITSPLVKLGLV